MDNKEPVFMEGEIVRKKDGSKFSILNENREVEEAILVQINQDDEIVYLATVESIARIWIEELEILSGAIVSTGECVSESSLRVLKEFVKQLRK